MTIEAALGRDLHGELLGLDGGIECDYVPPHSGTIDPDARIHYEAIRVVTSPTLDGRLPLPDGWVLDAARCPDHEVAALPYATGGFDEALVTLEVVPVEDRAYAVDGDSIRVIDRSPVDEGAQPVAAPPKVAVEPLSRADYGFDRLTRQTAMLPVYRHLGYRSYVEALTEALARGRCERHPDDRTDTST